MNKLILQMQMSADGFVGGDNQNRWQMWNWVSACPWDAELKRDFNLFFASIGTILLSRKMAEEGYIDHWARAAEKFADDGFFAFAQKITQTPKVVLSNRLNQSRWERTTVASGDLPREVDALKRSGPGNIAVFGGVGFASALIHADLVDEYQFFINPAASGSGAALFAHPGFRRLALVDSKHYDCGIVVNRYAKTARAP